MEGANSSLHILGNDLNNLSQSLTTRLIDKPRKIEDYFASAPPYTRQNSISGANITADAVSLLLQANNTEVPPKKFKITADNGRDVVMRQPERKRVKREPTLEDLGDEGNLSNASSVRRHNSRAKLRMLPSFPLDVIFEIFSHLPPADLLNLTRTTKDLRHLLLPRSASSVWKAVLLNVPELPDCPEDVSLPAWASLIFDSHCQNCLTQNVRSVNFYLRVRYCNKCVKIMLISDSTLNPTTNKLHEIILQAVPFSHWNERNGKFCTVEAREAFVKELDGIQGDRSAFVEERSALQKLRKKHARECKKWFEDLLETREAELDNLRLQRNNKIRDKLLGIGYQAEFVFLDDLEAGICGIRPWPGICPFGNHPQVKLPKLLTDKAWTKIEKEMVRYMKRVRKLVVKNERFLLERRRRIALHTAYVNWRHKPANLEAFPADMFLPGPADVLEASFFKSFVEAQDDEEYDAEDAMRILQYGIGRFINSWKTATLESIWSQARFSKTSDSIRFPPWRSLGGLEGCWPQFQLATFVLRCKSEDHWRYDEKRLEDDGIWTSGSGLPFADVKDNVEPCLWFPHFFFHPCTSMQLYGYEERLAGDNKNLSLENQYVRTRRMKFNTDLLEFDDKASRAVGHLLDAARLNHSTTTVEDMDRLGHRFVCLKCTFGARCDGSRKLRVWSWRDAVQHCFKTHFGDGRVTWECIRPEDAENARQLEVIEQAKRGYLAPQARKVWKCLRCRDTASDAGRMTKAQLKSHFRSNTKHGDADNMDDKEGTWYYKALDYSPRELPPVKISPASTTA